MEKSLNSKKVDHIWHCFCVYAVVLGNWNWPHLSKGFAKELAEEVQTLGLQAEAIDMKDYDPDDRLSHEVSD